MKRNILTTLTALSLLFAVGSTRGADFGRGDGGYYGHESGYEQGYGYGYPGYGYAPSNVDPGYVGYPWAYGYDDWLDQWSDYSLPPPAPNPTGPSKTIEIPPDHAQHHS
jgi:hypothetical protein